MSARFPKAWWFPVAALVLFGIRLGHLGPEIDDPHLWRQMDTAHYVRDFAENGIDLLNPRVCWMGSHRTLALEFPLPEAIVAAGLKLASQAENRLLERTVFLAFFLGAVAGFHGVAALLCGSAAARWATLLYLASPLGQFYSRAIHVDFFVLLCAHGMLLGLLSGLERRSWPRVLLGTAFATAGWLVKAPYLVVLWPAILGFVHERRRWPFFLRTLPLALVPVAALLLWQRHSHALNGAAPDWSFIIPDYHRMVGMWTWYFGTLAQRLDPGNWAVILVFRLGREVIGLGALPLFAWGLWLLRRRREAWTLVLWLLGALMGVAVFFNLNLVHDYYQLPLLAPTALIGARALERIETGLRSSSRPGLGLSVPLAAMVLVALISTAWTERRYYQVPPIPAAVGKVLRAETPPGSLLIVVWDRIDARAPHLLYPSHRDGWSVREEFLAPPVVERLRALGATWLAWVRQATPRPPALQAVRGYEKREFPLPEGARLELYDLAPPSHRAW